MTTSDSGAFDAEWIRGSCPQCGSGQVLHHVLGMPVLEDYETSPPWVL